MCATAFTYLTTGRDLLRLQTTTTPGTAALVVANPDFGAIPPGPTEAGPLAQLVFSPLPATAEEAAKLHMLLPQATVLTQAQATKQALQAHAAPRILHIATHGFFLDDVPLPPPTAPGRGLPIVDAPRPEVPPGTRIENPLLRSGLALAGANARRSGADNGILTALEVAGLNLAGTQLVVLSACDTGVGEVKNGEGVYGLRRALVLAGSATQVMSLWPVSDDETRDLMIGYYQGLQAGQGRAEALRRVQLAMLARPDQQHPYFWASFIQSGEWANLAGQRGGARLTTRRGCRSWPGFLLRPEVGVQELCGLPRAGRREGPEREPGFLAGAAPRPGIFLLDLSGDGADQAGALAAQAVNGRAHLTKRSSRRTPRG